MKKLKFVLVGVLPLILASCYESQPSQQMLLQECFELSTVEFVVCKTAYAVGESSIFKWGTRELAYEMKAYIEGGFDLEDIEDIDVDEKKKTVTITLPQPKILSMNIPQNEIVEKDETRTGLRSVFSDKEALAILQEGQKQIEEDEELKEIVYKEAKEQALLIIPEFYKNMGYSAKIKFKK